MHRRLTTAYRNGHMEGSEASREVNFKVNDKTLIDPINPR
ncbi:MAG: hypothetical protein JWN28_188 [Candidatus Saccharibacteria bacterium]|nr:hypothetical protein [Candidatus Saccharibacteria bacterium]